MGVRHGPPNALHAPKPTSSSRMTSTSGAPAGGSSGSIGGYAVSGSWRRRSSGPEPADLGSAASCARDGRGSSGSSLESQMIGDHRARRTRVCPHPRRGDPDPAAHRARSRPSGRTWRWRHRWHVRFGGRVVREVDSSLATVVGPSTCSPARSAWSESTGATSRGARRTNRERFVLGCTDHLREVVCDLGDAERVVGLRRLLRPVRRPGPGAA